LANVATFAANFEPFDRAVTNAQDNLRQFELSTKGVQAQLQRMTSGFDGSKLIREAQLAAKAVEAIGGASKLTDGEQKKLIGTISEAMAKYRALGIEAPAAISKLSKELADASKSGGLMSGALGQIKTIATGVFAGLSVAGAVAGIKQVATTALDTAGKLTDLSAQTGISASALDRMRLAAAPAGVELDTVTNAIAMMSDKLVSGDKSASSAVKALGLNLTNLKASKPNEAFLSIVEAISRVGDPMERAKLAFDTFGGRAKEVLRLVNDEFVKNAKNGRGWSDADIQALDDAGDAWQALGDRVILWSGKMIAAGLTAFDKVGEAARGIGRFIDGTDQTAPSSKNTFALKPATIGAANVSMGANGQSIVSTLPVADVDKAKVEKALDDFKKKVNGLTTETIKLGTETEKTGKAIKATATEYELWVKSLTPGVVATNLQVNALNAMAKAYDMVADAKTRGQGLGVELPGTRFGNVVSMAGLPGTPGMVRAAGLGTAVSLAGLPSAQTSNGFSWQKAGAIDWSGLMKAVPSQLVNVFAQGGGSKQIGSGIGSIAGSVGGQALGSMVSMAASAVGSTMGAALGSAIPVLGTIAGGFLGKAIGGLFGPSKNALATQQANANIAQTQAGLLQQFDGLSGIAGKNVAGQELAAAWGSKGTAGEAHFNALAAEFTRMTQEQNKLLGDQETTIAKITEYEERRNAAVEALKPTWAAVSELASKYQINVEGLGKAVTQLGTTASFKSLLEDIQTFERAGADVGGMLFGMKEEISKVVSESRRLGTEIPANMRPYVEELAKSGLLLDENGEKITDLSTLKWGAPVETEADKAKASIAKMDDTLAKLRDTLDKVVEALSRMLPNAAAEGARGVQDAFDRNRPTFRYDIEANGDGNGTRVGGDPPGFASGSGGIRNFGTGTLAMLHGREGVFTEAQIAALQRRSSGAGGGLGATVNVYVDASNSFYDSETSRQRHAELIGTSVSRGLRQRVLLARAA